MESANPVLLLQRESLLDAVGASGGPAHGVFLGLEDAPASMSYIQGPLSMNTICGMHAGISVHC